jgi:hypothetical protein
MLIIAETKIDNSFPDAQFKIDNYHSCRADRNAHGGGLIVYVRSDLACDRKNKLECKTIDSIMIEILINKRKWLISGLYRPQCLGRSYQFWFQQ